LLGIVKSKSLWLSDSRALNDHQESIWIDKYILEFLNSELDNKDIIDNILEVFKANNPIPFICCFSENGDLLSQWRAYADDGLGVSIGFDPPQFLIPFSLPMTSDEKDLTLGMYPVLYKDEEQKEVVESGLKVRISRILEVDSDRSESIMSAALWLRQMSFVFKNVSFEEEKEWRIIHTPLILSGGVDSDRKSHVYGGVSELEFRERNGFLVPYFPLSLGRSSAPAIAEVVLGPKSRLDAKTLKLMLATHGHENVEVTKSSASLR
jgi:hypothetical protein